MERHTLTREPKKKRKQGVGKQNKSSNKSLKTECEAASLWESQGQRFSLISRHRSTPPECVWSVWSVTWRGKIKPEVAEASEMKVDETVDVPSILWLVSPSDKQEVQEEGVFNKADGFRRRIVTETETAIIHFEVFFPFKAVFAPTMARVITLLFRLYGYGPKITILALKSEIVRQRKMSFRFCCVRSFKVLQLRQQTTGCWVFGHRDKRLPLFIRLWGDLHCCGGRRRRERDDNIEKETQNTTKNIYQIIFRQDECEIYFFLKKHY